MAESIMIVLFSLIATLAFLALRLVDRSSATSKLQPIRIRVERTPNRRGR